MTMHFFVSCYWEFGVTSGQNALAGNFLILITCLLDIELKLQGDFGNVYTDAVSNRHGFMASKPDQKRYGFEGLYGARWTIFDMFTYELILVGRSEILRKIKWPFSNQCGFTVYTIGETVSFSNTPPLTAFSKWPGFRQGLDWRRVNGRRNRIEIDAVTNETVYM